MFLKCWLYDGRQESLFVHVCILHFPNLGEFPVSPNQSTTSTTFDATHYLRMALLPPIQWRHKHIKSPTTEFPFVTESNYDRQNVFKRGRTWTSHTSSFNWQKNDLGRSRDPHRPQSPVQVSSRMSKIANDFEGPNQLVVDIISLIHPLRLDLLFWNTMRSWVRNESLVPRYAI